MLLCRRRPGDRFRFVIMAAFGMAVATASQAAALNHDFQRVDLRAAAAARHDRASSPAEIVPAETRD